MSQDIIKEKLKEYKKSKKEDGSYLLPVYQENKLIAYLHPITFNYKVSLRGIVDALSDWRRKTPNAWASVFDVTHEGTEEWLEKYVLGNEKRIIFVIQDLDNHYIGQIGLAEFDYSEKSAEVDAVVRGRKDILPGVMSAALKTLVEWGKRELKLERFFLYVFDDNVHAIEFYKKNNFIEKNRIALNEVKCGAGVRWEINEKIHPKQASRCYIRMELND